MRHRLMFLLVCGLGLGIGAVAQSGDEPIFSGPQPGEKFVPFEVRGVYGRYAGKDLELVSLAEGKAMLLIFVHASNRPAARLTRALVNYAEMRAQDGLFPAVVHLVADRSEAEQSLRRAISWWGMNSPVGISLDGAEGPGSYGLNRNVTLTILIGKGNEVTANFALVQPSVTDAPKILEEIHKLIGGTVPSEKELDFLAAPTRKPPNVPWHRSTSDPNLRRLLCDLIRSQENEKLFEKALAAVDRYVAGDRALQDELGESARSLLTKGYQNSIIDATRRASIRRWVSKFAAEGPR